MKETVIETIIVVMFKSYIFIIMNYVNINKSNQQNILVETSIQIYEKILREETNGTEDNSTFHKVLNELGIGTKFIFQFGTGIGSLIGPVTGILNNSGLSLSEEDICLLILTSLAILITNSSEDVSKLYNEVISRGLGKHVASVSKFILSTKKLMSYVGKQIGEVVHTLSDVLGFTFMLVPTMDVLKELINTHSIDTSDISRLMYGLSLASLSYYVKTIINKIKK